MAKFLAMKKAATGAMKKAAAGAKVIKGSAMKCKKGTSSNASVANDIKSAKVLKKPSIAAGDNEKEMTTQEKIDMLNSKISQYRAGNASEADFTS